MLEGEQETANIPRAGLTGNTDSPHTDVTLGIYERRYYLNGNL